MIKDADSARRQLAESDGRGELDRGTEAPRADELMALTHGARLGAYEITGTLVPAAWARYIVPPTPI